MKRRKAFLGGRAELPEAQPLDRPWEPVELAAPKEISYLDEEE